MPLRRTIWLPEALEATGRRGSVGRTVRQRSRKTDSVGRNAVPTPTSVSCGAIGVGLVVALGGVLLRLLSDRFWIIFGCECP